MLKSKSVQPIKCFNKVYFKLEKIFDLFIQAFTAWAFRKVSESVFKSMRDPNLEECMLTDEWYVIWRTHWTTRDYTNQ